MNPYSGANFFQFIETFFKRLFQSSPLMQDEIQVYTLCCIAISSALVGTFLVLRRMCMLANSLSHTILTGIAIAFVLHHYFGMRAAGELFVSFMPSESITLIASISMACITVFLTDFLIEKVQVKDDAATGIVFSLLFAIGIIVITLLSRNAHIGAELVMGNADLLTLQDLIVSLQMAVINLCITIVCFRPLFYSSFDPVFAQVIGIKPALFRYLLMLELVLTAIAAFRAVGVLMVVAFFVVPPLVARRLTARLTTVVVLSCVIAVVSSFVSVALSRHLLSEWGIAVSTSALCVVLLALLLVASLLSKKSILNTRSIA